MGIFYASKFTGSVIGLLGVGASIGIPVALNSSKRDSFEHKKIAESTQPKLNKCQAESVNEKLESVNFAEQTSQEICGKIDDSGSNQIELSGDEKYTHLFQQNWNKKGGNGDTNNSYGKRNCELKDKGMITIQVGGKEFLGLCDNTNSSKEGIMITDKSSKDLKVEVCKNDCFESTSEHGGEKLDPTKIKGVGAKIRFFKKS